MNLAAAFLAQAEEHPERRAVFYGAEGIPYRRFADRSACVAAELIERLGVRPGDRVGLWLPNRPEFISAFFGILRADAAAVPINYFLKPAEVAYILRDAGIRVLISSADLEEGLAVLRGQMPELRALKVEAFEGLSSPAGSFEPRSGKDDLAVLIYTSGTTGKPKGAMLSHGNLLSNVASCRAALKTVESDRFALTLPMFHSFMLTVCVLLPLVSGSSLVLVRSLHPLRAAIEQIVRHKATILPAMPQLFRALASIEPPEGLALRLCISGSAPLPVSTLHRFNDRYPCRLVEGYGLSEASPVVSFNPIEGVQKPGSIGLPIRDVEASIRDDEGNQLPPGKIGELWVRGPNVMLGYWNQPQATAEALREGWLLTGDVGYMDEEGYIYITDRKKDMFLVNGINVYPREIEEALHHFPGVQEAAVIGVPDPRRGEQPVAFLVPEPGVSIDKAALRRFLKEQLADYKIPRHIRIVSELPKNATGKILKWILRQDAHPVTSGSS